MADSTFSQELDIVNDIEERLLYHHFFSGGLYIHSSGWGINARKGINPNVKWNKFYELDVVNMKHSKEIKMYHPLYDNLRGYVYGKKNVFIPVRIGYGFERLIADKASKNSVKVQFVSSGGLSAGLLKPVYLEILKPTSLNPEVYYIAIEKYNSAEHQMDNIYGNASFRYGLNEISIMPGIYTKVGFNFSYNKRHKRRTSLEAGAIIDYYFRQVEIMDSEAKIPMFLTFYISLTYGLKCNR